MPLCFSFKIMSSSHVLSSPLKTVIHLMTKKNKILGSLPPTSNVSHGHILRSNYVVLNCSNLILGPDTSLNLVKFDRNSVDSVLIPNKCVVTLPEMYNITCGCKKNCTGKCQCCKFSASYSEFCKCNRKV